MNKKMMLCVDATPTLTNCKEYKVSFIIEGCCSVKNDKGRTIKVKLNRFKTI